MSKAIIVFGVLFGLVLFGCNNENNSKDTLGKDKTEEEVNMHENTLENLKWIEGVWIDSTTYSFRSPLISLVEEWKYYPDSLSGRGLSIKEGDTTVTETLLIIEVNGKINFIARPSGQALIGYPMIEIGNGEVVFENKAQNFPQKISYQSSSKDSLNVTISGVVPQGERKVTFKMTSVSF